VIGRGAIDRISESACQFRILRTIDEELDRIADDVLQAEGGVVATRKVAQLFVLARTK
jgi:hypothetical protein